MSFHAATEIGRSVDRIALVATVVTVALCLFVAALLAYFCVKYRAGSPANREGRSDSSWTVEIFNFTVILAFGLTLFLWGARLFYEESAAPAGALELYVLGKQWMWTFQYPGGPKQIGRVLVPLGRPVRVLLASDDVIHSFFVPSFRVKQDAVPGRYTSLWFEAKETGEFAVLCSEYCGTSHSGMRATIEVVTPERFDAWRNGHREASVTGEALYRRMSCDTCHDNRRAAPELKGIYGKRVDLAGGGTVIADENYLRRALLEPSREVARGYSALMPTYRGLLSEEEITALIQYLKGAPGRAGAEASPL
jgi:cytochrome c oxidase subunit 2